MNDSKVILSLFDYSGNWSKPYREAGYQVVQQDIKHGQDIFADTLPECLSASTDGFKVHGILAAVPCTEFASSGARWWAEKESTPADYDGPIEFDSVVEMAVGMVLATLAIIEWLEPKWWCIENPIGRIGRLVPELKPFRMLDFDPCEFGDPYTKRTVLYGVFNPFLVRQPVKPKEGSKMHTLPPSKQRQALRSETPAGFAQAFFNANP